MFGRQPIIRVSNATINAKQLRWRSDGRSTDLLSHVSLEIWCTSDRWWCFSQSCRNRGSRGDWGFAVATSGSPNSELGMYDLSTGCELGAESFSGMRGMDDKARRCVYGPIHVGDRHGSAFAATETK